MPPCYIADLWAYKMKGVKEWKGTARDLFFLFETACLQRQCELGGIAKRGLLTKFFLNVISKLFGIKLPTG